MKENLEGKNVLIVGAARSGLAAARLLLAQRARVTVTDLKRDAALPPGVAGRLGEHREEDFTGADMVVLSPGVPLTLPQLAAAQRRGVPIVGEIELAFRYISAPIIAVSGTNGKSTTTALIGEILFQWGKRRFLGGNLESPLGRPLSEAAGDYDYVVAELSSFQLETIARFRPAVAVLLNVTPDHLDRHSDFDAYRRAKGRIFENQTGSDAAVVNLADPEVASIVKSGRLAGRVIDFSKHPLPIPKERIGIRGAHNVENARAAAAAASLLGAPQEAIGKALERFSGLPHRMQVVREVGGVVYIDDSKGTNVGAVLKSLSGVGRPTILIAGGREKGSDFTLLIPVIKERARRVILLGEAAGKIEGAIAGAVPVERAESMSEAVKRAAAAARPGDAVLLSPACASFDMFKDFAERGEAFASAVREL